MISDKEMLLLAAKAYGIENAAWWESVDNPPFPDAQCVIYYADGDPCPKCFNPLNDDGEALRLLVKLNVQVNFYDGHYHAHIFYTDDIISDVLKVCEPVIDGDLLSSARRAIVRAAAEIGRRL